MAADLSGHLSRFIVSSCLWKESTFRHGLKKMDPAGIIPFADDIITTILT